MPDPQTVRPAVGPPDVGLGGSGATGAPDRDRSADSDSTPSARFATLSDEHPEVVLAAALVGGFLLATIIKRLAR